MLDLEQIGRYTISRELGRGGMATVYLAHDPRFERDVAIKVLPRQFTHDPRFLTRFEREAKTIAALEHPAIVPVHDFGEFDDTPFLVMRYMSGGSLRQRMQGKPLPLPEIKRILDRLAPALDKAHVRGVVHRDLKPDNVLFDEDNLPYLADFGIVRLAEATQTMTIVGTPAYMSPEQVQGQGQLDGRSDIYAVGVMLFEMLSGKQPYVADTPTRQMMQHLLEPIPDVVAANPALVPEWQTVIDTVMAKEPSTRYATAAQLAAAVAALMPGTETKAASLPLITPIAVAQPPSQAPQSEPTNAGTRGMVAETDIPRVDTPQPAKQARSPLAKTVIDTPPELTMPPAQRRFKLPAAWAWWGGAVLILLLLAWGISGMFGGGTDNLEATWTVEAAVVVADTTTPTPQPDVIVAETPTTTPIPQPDVVIIETPTTTPTERPSATPTKTPIPTTTLDPNMPPPEPTLGSTWQRPADEMTLVYVPGGIFPMGNSDEQFDFAFELCELARGSSLCKRSWFEDETPQHDVTLDGFWIDQTEVTNDQYAALLNVNGNQPEGGVAWLDLESDIFRPQSGFADHPVIEVTWYGAQAYCEWVGGQLLTEAQWEYAARGEDGSIYPWGNKVPDCKLANYGLCAHSTTPVGDYADGASWVGAMDMAGNVQEWVQDRYANDYYANAPSKNPKGPASGDGRIKRGGSWFFSHNLGRSTDRTNSQPSRTDRFSGFRCAQE